MNIARTMVSRTSMFVRPGAADHGFGVYSKKPPRAASRIGAAMGAARKGVEGPSIHFRPILHSAIHPLLAEGLRAHVTFPKGRDGIQLAYADSEAAPWLADPTKAQHFRDLMCRDRVGIVEALEGAYAREGLHFVVQDDAVFFLGGEDMIRALDHYTTPRRVSEDLLRDTLTGKYFALRVKAVRIIRKDVHVLELEFPFGTSILFSGPGVTIQYPPGFLVPGEEGPKTHSDTLPKRFLLDAEGNFTYQAGNSMWITAALGKNHMEQRSYTIATRPGTPYLDVVFNRVPGGMMSNYLFSLGVDDVVFVHTTSGSGGFRLFDDISGPQIFVTTGTGIAAPRAMVPELFKSPGTPYPVIVISGNKYQMDHLSVRYLGELKKYNPNLHILNVSSRDVGLPWQTYNDGSGNVRMRYAQHVLERLLSSVEVNGVRLTADQIRNANIYFCGRPEMVVEGEQLLDRLEFPRQRTRKDIFI